MKVLKLPIQVSIYFTGLLMIGGALLPGSVQAGATGGVITTNGTPAYLIHTFTNDGTFTVSGGSVTCDVLVVAGGGGGGRLGGGGGAGGLIYTSAFPVAVGAYPVTIGGGGGGSISRASKGGNGTNSVFSTITAIGGGGGGSSSIESGLGATGGSGGGGGGTASNNVGLGSPPQGNNGGNGDASGVYASNCGGGGGFCTIGTNASSGSHGGNGTNISISGSSVPYAGGGGGGAVGSIGGSGGGGAGAGGNATGTVGTASTGGGGGGARDSMNLGGNGGAGGAGVVIVKYLRELCHYVSTNGGNVSPYTHWVDAATNIQDAIDVSIAGDTVLVSNGVYNYGGITNNLDNVGTTNRIVINKAITVQSANNDPARTIIVGGGSAKSDNAIRCVLMYAGSSLIGFTLTNGFTRATPNGGGVMSPSTTNTVISNCVITGCQSGYSGGGVYWGTLYNCIISDNIGGTYAGGAVSANLFNCSLLRNTCASGGGAARLSILYNCLVKNNYTASPNGGGGALASTLYNCLITSNSAPYGGGAKGSGLYNCTVVSNNATTSGGGVSTSGVYNSIVYFNTAPSGSNWVDLAGATNSCIAPEPGGVGNITGNPIFVDWATANLRLSGSSPCVNKGINQEWMNGAVDFDGKPRIRYGTVDMGAYETIYGGTVYQFH